MSSRTNELLVQKTGVQLTMKFFRWQYVEEHSSRKRIVLTSVNVTTDTGNMVRKW